MSTGFHYFSFSIRCNWKLHKCCVVGICCIVLKKINFAFGCQRNTGKCKFLYEYTHEFQRVYAPNWLFWHGNYLLQAIEYHWSIVYFCRFQCTTLSIAIGFHVLSITVFQCEFNAMNLLEWRAHMTIFIFYIYIAE